MVRRRYAHSDLDTIASVIDRVDPPSPEEERALILAAKDEALPRRARDDAVRRLAEGHLRFLWKKSREFGRPHGLEAGDFLSAAVCAVWEAVRKFDPDRGVKFITYLGFWVFKSLNECGWDEGRTIRIPRGEWRKLGEGAPRPTAAVQWDHRHYDPEEVAGAADVDTTDLAGREDRDRLWAALDSLPARMRMVLECHFGFRAGGEETMQSIARRLGVSRERVRQIKDKGLQALRDRLCAAEGVVDGGEA